MPFANVGTLRLYYEEHGHGTPLILVHGGFESIADLDSQVQPFSKSYRLIRYDRRGCGKSQPKKVPHAHDLWVEDHRGFMQALGLSSAVVGGVSFGGMLTIELMARYPHLLKGAIVVSATAGGYPGSPGYEVPFPKRLEELKRVQIPTLVIHGSADDIFPVSDAQAIAKAIPHAELVVLKGGHSINVDDKEGFNKAVLGWLARHHL